MMAKLRSCCRIAAPVGGSAASPTSADPTTMATPKATQNGTFHKVSRRSTEDVIEGSHDSTASHCASLCCRPPPLRALTAACASFPRTAAIRCGSSSNLDLLTFARGEAVEGAAAARHEASRFGLHRRYHVVGMHRIVVEQRQRSHIRLQCDLHRRTQRGMPPADLFEVLLVGILRLADVEIGPGDEGDECLVEALSELPPGLGPLPDVFESDPILLVVGGIDDRLSADRHAVADRHAGVI